MYKLITILVAAIPIIVFLKTVFGRSQVVKQASAEFRKQIDYLVWVILLVIGCVFVYLVANLIHSSSLLKNEESAAFSLFLPSLVWGLWCCERTLAYAASSLGIRIKL